MRGAPRPSPLGSGGASAAAHCSQPHVRHLLAAAEVERLEGRQAAHSFHPHVRHQLAVAEVEGRECSAAAQCSHALVRQHTEEIVLALHPRDTPPPETVAPACPWPRRWSTASPPAASRSHRARPSTQRTPAAPWRWPESTPSSILGFTLQPAASPAPSQPAHPAAPPTRPPPSPAAAAIACVASEARIGAARRASPRHRPPARVDVPHPPLSSRCVACARAHIP
jgi:hypothetical protein